MSAQRQWRKIIRNRFATVPSQIKKIKAFIKSTLHFALLLAITIAWPVYSQPRITSITVRDFTDTTPWYAAFVFHNFESGPRWIQNGTQNDQLCREVTLTFSTRSDRTYQVQSSAILLPPKQVGGLVTGGSWTTLTLPVQGTGGTMVWTMGMPFSFQAFRLVER